MRILIAEDDPVSRLILVTTVRGWGFDPAVACDGEEALKTFHGPEPPQIAILDWMMPGIDGPELCRRVREIPSARSVYIILLTAKAQREDLITGLMAGADDYVTKPFHSQELFARFHVGLRVAGLHQSLSERLQELEGAIGDLRHVQQSIEALSQLSAGISYPVDREKITDLPDTEKMAS